MEVKLDIRERRTEWLPLRVSLESVKMQLGPEFINFFIIVLPSVVDALLHQDRSDQMLSLLHQNHLSQNRQGKWHGTRDENQHSWIRNISGEYWKMHSSAELLLCYETRIPDILRCSDKQNQRSVVIWCSVWLPPIAMLISEHFLTIYLHKGVFFPRVNRQSLTRVPLPVANSKVCSTQGDDKAAVASDHFRLERWLFGSFLDQNFQPNP
jgi:hypothetical protein